MSSRLLWIILLPLLSASALGATMNKCIQPNGHIEFTDQPCASGTAANPNPDKKIVLHIQSTGNGIDSISSITLLAGSKKEEGAIDGTGASARFNNPGGITSDGKNLYIVDTGNQTIRKLELATGKVTTLAGRVGKRGHKDGIGNEARFNIPQGIAIDGDYLYVTDVVSYCIRKISIRSGEVTTLAGNPGNPGRTDGTGKEATFSYPLGITAVGGYLYVTEMQNYTIRKIEIDTGKVTTFAGKTILVKLDPSVLSNIAINVTGHDVWSHVPGYVDGTGQDARFSFPTGITNDGKNLYVSDSHNHKIRKIDIATAIVTTLAGPDEASCAAGFKGKCPGGGSPVDGPASEARFSYPDYLATDGKYLYVDNSNNDIRRVSLATGEVKTLINRQARATRGSEIALQLDRIWGLLISDDHSLIVADRLGNAIYRLQ